MEGKLSWLRRIMYLIPVFLCIVITNIVVIKNTRIKYEVPARITNESVRRGYEELEQQRRKDELETLKK